MMLHGDVLSAIEEDVGHGVLRMGALMAPMRWSVMEVRDRAPIRDRVVTYIVSAEREIERTAAEMDGGAGVDFEAWWSEVVAEDSLPPLLNDLLNTYEEADAFRSRGFIHGISPRTLELVVKVQIKELEVLGCATYGAVPGDAHRDRLEDFIREMTSALEVVEARLESTEMIVALWWTVRVMGWTHKSGGVDVVRERRLRVRKRKMDSGTPVPVGPSGMYGVVSVRGSVSTAARVIEGKKLQGACDCKELRRPCVVAGGRLDGDLCGRAPGLCTCFTCGWLGEGLLNECDNQRFGFKMTEVRDSEDTIMGKELYLGEEGGVADEVVEELSACYLPPSSKSLKKILQRMRASGEVLAFRLSDGGYAVRNDLVKGSPPYVPKRWEDSGVNFSNGWRMASTCSLRHRNCSFLEVTRVVDSRKRRELGVAVRLVRQVGPGGRLLGSYGLPEGVSCRCGVEGCVSLLPGAVRDVLGEMDGIVEGVEEVYDVRVLWEMKARLQDCVAGLEGAGGGATNKAAWDRLGAQLLIVEVTDREEAATVRAGGILRDRWEEMMECRRVTGGGVEDFMRGCLDIAYSSDEDPWEFIGLSVKGAATVAMRQAQKAGLRFDIIDVDLETQFVVALGVEKGWSMGQIADSMFGETVSRGALACYWAAAHWARGNCLPPGELVMERADIDTLSRCGPRAMAAAARLLQWSDGTRYRVGERSQAPILGGKATDV
jgi:hypothetical protein